MLVIVFIYVSIIRAVFISLVESSYNNNVLI